MTCTYTRWLERVVNSCLWTKLLRTGCGLARISVLSDDQAEGVAESSGSEPSGRPKSAGCRVYRRTAHVGGTTGRGEQLGRLNSAALSSTMVLVVWLVHRPGC